MLVTKTQHGQTWKVTLSGALTVFHVAQVHQNMWVTMQSLTPVIVDFSDVQSIDTAGLQLLLFIKKSSLHQGSDWRFVAPSKRVQDVCRLLDMDQLFTLVHAAS
jgi:anti-sigma B factor antagonist